MRCRHKDILFNRASVAVSAIMLIAVVLCAGTLRFHHHDAHGNVCLVVHDSGHSAGEHNKSDCALHLDDSNIPIKYSGPSISQSVKSFIHDDLLSGALWLESHQIEFQDCHDCCYDIGNYSSIALRAPPSEC